MGEGRSAFRFCSLSVLDHQPVEVKKVKLSIKLELTKRLKYRQGTCNVIGNFKLGTDHVAVHVG